MTSLELMQNIGQVKSCYILEAQEPEKASHSRPKRILLVAAVAALILALVGCAAAYVMKLQDFKVGTFHWTEDAAPLEHSSDILSLQGTAETPNAKALAEWEAFKESYDPDSTLLSANNRNEAGLPDNYFQAYNCYTWEMKEHLDGILQKYDLKILEEPIYFDSADRDATLRYTGIDRLLPDGEAEYLGGTLYREGAFKQELRLSGRDISMEYQYLDRQYLLPYGTSMGDLEAYQQWEYCGALLALGEKKAMILYQRPDAVITVSVYFWGTEKLNQTELEQLAELFDFQIKPQCLSDDTLAEIRQVQKDKEDALQQAYQAELNRIASLTANEWYAENVANMLRSGRNQNTGYTFRDLNGDGEDELLLGMDGYIFRIFSRSASPFYYDTLYLSRDNVLVRVGTDCRDDSVPAQEHFDFLTLSGDELSLLQSIKKDSAGWYQTKNLQEAYSPISETEYQRILDSYPRIPLELMPLRSYPLEEPAEYDPEGMERFYGGNTLTLEEYLQLEKRSLRERYGTSASLHYAFAMEDFDGDGQAELLERDAQGLYNLHAIVSGGQRNILQGKPIVPCQNGIILCRSYFTEACQTWNIYRLSSGTLTQWDCLRYDADRNAENPWFHSQDGTGQDTAMRPISEAEFHRILDSYEPLALEMKSFED